MPNDYAFHLSPRWLDLNFLKVQIIRTITGLSAVTKPKVVAPVISTCENACELDIVRKCCLRRKFSALNLIDLAVWRGKFMCKFEDLYLEKYWKRLGFLVEDFFNYRFKLLLNLLSHVNR